MGIELDKGLPEESSAATARSSNNGEAGLEEIQNLLREAVADEPALTILKGFKLDFSANKDFHKVFFSVRCECGTAALLSVEVARSKTLPQVSEALPELARRLKAKSRQFAGMSCDMHTRMRIGGATQAAP
ncbi:MAG: hypothetical protein J4F46_01785 [Dehalococcoidia bacterium]|nr:hypothetical protein [Dehalococcoidia bacterium]